ncbi:MAG: GEVED domain-containing protein [Aquaticitalea sp.]
MKKIYILFIIVSASFSGFAQLTTLYSENFPVNGKGAIAGALGSLSTDLSGVDWTIDISNANLGAGFFGGNADYFYTIGNRFGAKDTDGPAIWYSPVIPTSGFSNVSFSLAAAESGTMEANDYIRTEYQVNGTGAWITAATNGALSDDFTSSTVSQTGLNGITSIRIRVTIDNDADDEFHYFDDVIVTGVCSTPVNVTALTATPAGGQVSLNWTNSSCYDEVLVVAKSDTAVTAIPTGNGSAYTANAAFGSGTQIVANEFVVYKGTGATVNVTALTNNTTYHFKVFTRKGSVWSSGVVTNATPTVSYCAATGTNNNFEYISNVQLNTINNTSAGNLYTYYSAISTNLVKGSQYNLSISVTWPTASQYNEGYGVWIDYNQNGDFTDPGERIFTQSLTQTNPVTGSFVIPTNAVLGTTRMRVVMVDQATQSPCGTVTYGEVEDYNVNILPPITYVFNNGWTPSDPNGVSTSINDIIIANGDAVISSNTSANSVLVSSTASLTINTGSTFTVLNNVNMDSNSVNYSSLIVNGTLSGNVNYTRHVNGQPGTGVGAGANDLISAPVSGQTFAAFASANSNLTQNPSNTDQKRFGPFSKTTGSYLSWNVVADGANVLAAGVGYRAATSDNAGLVFSGTANKDVVTNNVVNSGPYYAQWNLIGNPYPSYISIFDFLNYNVAPGVKNIDLMTLTSAAIYGYDGDASGVNGNGYTVYNLANSTGVNMAPGQGFLVTADAAMVAGYDMTFAPSMRRIGNTDDFIPGRVNANNVHLKLQAAIGTANYSTSMYFNDVATSGMDFGYDAGVYGNSANTKAIYSQLAQDNTGVDLAIQSLAYADLGTDIIVPLGINVPQGQQVTVSIAESDLPAHVEVYLEDNVTGAFTLLNVSDYVFTSSTNLNDTGRFFLRFSDQTLTTNEVNLNGLQIFATATPRAIFVKGQLATATTVSLYDIQGRLVLSSALDIHSNSNQVDVSNLSSGVYVVKLSNNSQQKTQKVILK